MAFPPQKWLQPPKQQQQEVCRTLLQASSATDPTLEMSPAGLPAPNTAWTPPQGRRPDWEITTTLLPRQESWLNLPPLLRCWIIKHPARLGRWENTGSPTAYPAPAPPADQRELVGMLGQLRTGPACRARGRGGCARASCTAVVLNCIWPVVPTAWSLLSKKQLGTG